MSAKFYFEDWVYIQGLCLGDQPGPTFIKPYQLYPWITDYSQIPNISHTKSYNLNISRLVLQLSFHNPLKPGVKSRMKM